MPINNKVAKILRLAILHQNDAISIPYMHRAYGSQFWEYAFRRIKIRRFKMYRAYGSAYKKDVNITRRSGYWQKKILIKTE